MLEDHVTYKHSSCPQAFFIFHVFEGKSYYLEKTVINGKPFFPANPGNCLYGRKRISNPSVFSLCDRGPLALDRLHLSSQQRNAAVKPVLTGNNKYIYMGDMTQYTSTMHQGNIWYFLKMHLHAKALYSIHLVGSRRDSGA